MKPFLRHLLFSGFILASAGSAAQETYSRSLEVGAATSGLKISHIEEDSAGFLWLGTNQGIFRYNGRQSIAQPWLPAASRSEISLLHVAGNMLTAGFRNGSLLCVRTDLPGSAVTYPRLAKATIIAASTDPSGALWIGTDGDGVYRISGNTIRRFGEEDGLPDLVAHTLLCAGNSTCIGTDLGLHVLSWNGQDYTGATYTTEDGLGDNLITSLAAGRDENILVGAFNGTVTNFNLHTRHADPLPALSGVSASPILRVYRVGEEVWSINEEGEAWLVRWPDDGTLKHLVMVDPLTGQAARRISDVILSREGLLIMAQDDHRLITSDHRLVFMSHHEGVPLTGIRALTCDNSGNIWFAAEDGVYRHDLGFGEKSTLRKFLDNDQLKGADVVSMSEGPDGGIWLGTFGRGLARIDPQSGTIRWFTEMEGLVNNNVLSIASYRGELWMATLGGLCRMNVQEGAAFTGYNEESALGTSYVYTVHSASDDALWIGTDGKGLVSWDGQRFHSLRSTHPSLDKSIVSIATDNSGAVWMLGAEKGVQVWNGETVADVPVILQGQKARVLAIAPDARSGVILFTEGGIASMSRPGEKARFIYLDPGFTTSYLQVAARDKFSQVWLGSNSALVRLNDYTHARSTEPQPRIESVWMHFQPVDSTRHSFGTTENHFTFRLAGLWFQQPESVQFRYWLEGYDFGWRSTGDDQVVYSRLEPGEYTFHLECGTDRDEEPRQHSAYHFVIRPPLWQQAWFISLAAFVFLLLAWTAVKLRTRAVQRKEAIRRELLQSQFETLRNQVNPHFLFNSFNTLLALIETDPRDAADYVERLSEYFRLILQQRDKEKITLGEELLQVEHYLYLQKKRFGNSLVIRQAVGPAALNAWIPPMTLQLLCENAVKHNVITEKAPLVITIETQDGVLRVSNNLQRRPQAEPGTGVGLENIRNRFRILFGREIAVTESTDRFTVELPLLLPDASH